MGRIVQRLLHQPGVLERDGDRRCESLGQLPVVVGEGRDLAQPVGHLQTPEYAGGARQRDEQRVAYAFRD